MGGNVKRDELLAFHKGITEAALELMTRKNHDYAGRGGDDPFANFRRCEAMGVCTTPQGFLVRLCDKFSRLSTFAEAGQLLVKDEGVRDTCLDIINYAILLAAYVDSEKTKG
jgi:hypothetical protein